MQLNNQNLHLSIVPVIVFLLTISMGAAVLIAANNLKKTDEQIAVQSPEESYADTSCVLNISIAAPAQAQEPEKHLECVNEACTEFDGAGDDECDNNSDCAEEEETHLECVNESCQEVDGSGSNECDSDNDCDEEEETHMECVSNSCREVDGEGDDECDSNSDCVSEQIAQTESRTHLECLNKACVTVEGQGANTCSSNSDCAVPADVVKQEQKPKPAVPETGIKDYLFYIPFGILLMMLGYLTANMYRKR